MLKLKRKPKKIYAIGNIELLQNKAFAIVGTRKNTEYGLKYTKRFANQLSIAGITIVSGMALGIDSIAHKNSMKNKGKTIAVMGSGFNNIYPEENKKLFKDILKNGGCIVSEYPPETKINMLNFPTRNRIIAGLSCGVLVTEARVRSGSSITAKRAIEQNKPVFCLPNQIGLKTGVGTNNLIKDGAYLVTDINDILLKIKENEMDIREQKKIEKEIEKEELKEKKRIINKNKKKEQKSFENKIDEKYRRIYEVLKQGPIDIEDLAIRTNKSIVELNQKITIMEIENLIEILPGNIIRVKDIYK